MITEMTLIRLKEREALRKVKKVKGKRAVAKCPRKGHTVICTKGRNGAVQGDDYHIRKLATTAILQHDFTRKRILLIGVSGG